MDHPDQQTTQPTHDWEGSFHAFDQAIKAIRRNANPAIFYVAVLAVVTIATSLLVNKSLLPQRAHESQLVASSFVVTLVLLPYSICYPLALAKGLKVTIDELLSSSFKQYFNLIITFILILVLIVVGAIALIFPLIWIMPWVALMYFVVVDRNCGPLVALREARRLTAHNKGKVWGIIGISIPLVLVASFLRYIPIVGNLVQPIVYLAYTTALAFLYEWLKKNVKNVAA